MKKSILLVMSIITFSVAIAQKGKVTTATTLLDQSESEKAKTAIDEAVANVKSNTWPKTFIVAAKVYTQLSKDGKDDDGILKAYGYYSKAIELDKKGDEKGKKIGRYKNEISQQILLFSSELTNSGVQAFNKNDFSGAVKAFESLLELNKNEYLVALQGEKIDSAIIFNTALAAYNGKDWANAEKYFNESIDLGYGGSDAIILLHQAFGESADSTKIAPNLKRGFEIYPEDERILRELINYYLTTNNNDKALDYLNKAIASDNTNPSFYYARGVLNDSNKDFEAALADYKRCLELDNEYLNSLYNLGVMYFNKGVEEANTANAETNTKKYEAKKEIAQVTFKEALPYFESALSIAFEKELKVEQMSIMESLKTLYYRFEMMEKYKEISDKLDALK